MRELNNFVDNVATWLPIRINVIQDYFLKSSLRNILVELDQNFTTKKNYSFPKIALNGFVVYKNFFPDKVSK